MISLTRRSLSASSLGLLAGCATGSAQSSAAPTSSSAAIGAFGLDLTAGDPSVAPGDDFFRHANGRWLDATQIPADRVSWGASDMLADKADRDIRAIVEEVARTGGAPGSNEQKIADYYNAFLDGQRIEQLGLAPAQADLAEIAALQTHEQVVRLMARPDMPVLTPIGIGVTLDRMDPNRYVVGMSHGGISLPDRDYYLRDDDQFTSIRNEFRAHVARMLTLANQTDAEAKATRILALQTEIARLHWPLAERRDRQRTYNPRTRAQVRELAPNFPWDAMFDGAEMAAVPDVIISELSAMGPLAELMLATPVSTWREYLTYAYLTNRGNILPRAFDLENFGFYNRTLNGQPEQRERWKRAIAAVNGAVPEAVGQLYVARHFPPEAKVQMLELVENMRRAYGERIDGLTWMTASTKAAARAKLRTFNPKIGYPDRWRDYSALEVRAGDAFGNARRSVMYTWRYDLARLGRPTDKAEWLYMAPQEVNAYYNPIFNELVFAAAILQPPYFDPNADPAVNYGAIGGVIGHEMGHGFDDQGSKSDAYGVMRDWWSAADLAAFTARTDRLVAQYDRFEALPGLNVGGRMTLGENIGDNGGLQVAYYAYHLSLNGREAPVLDSTTGDQRFFLGWAQAWREAIRDEALRTQVVSDVHSPARFRVNGPVRNMNSWYAAFNVQPGAQLYLPDAERVEIW